MQFSSRVYDSLNGLQVAYTLRYTAILRLSKNDKRIEHEFIDEMTTEYIRFDGTVGWYAKMAFQSLIEKKCKKSEFPGKNKYENRVIEKCRFLNCFHCN